ncbi:hypothetical protein [Arthrobacter russicus]|jgi:hypothetical protein|uniref:Uncharacterized protein n=1 Tax=Arthrobacter russicus TaxID=172040 RepID=A0ABU1JC34_9MICC|nr:hypothetical protein [Arthrobacter russicus]MBQ1444955.1 hypothetical protein [Renibacterium sp.]MDN5666997.1 hypothetical protein [Renibacterium salmoninarum]MDR6269964.1 hypothetical protein [Arthrobacter russicus]
MPAESDVRNTVLTAARGGIMTDEVGVITGDVEIESSWASPGHAAARCRYDGADEWYAITDAARELAAGTAEELTRFHEALVQRYRQSDPV